MTDDQRQQKQDEEERMRTTLYMLRRVWEGGLKDEAIFLAVEVGLSRQFTQYLQQRRAA